jgi:seryl-tRNA synthetase
MHDIRWIRENAAEFDRGLARRGLAPEADKLIAIDEKRRGAIQKSEQAQARRNAASKEIGAAKAKKDEATASKLMAEVNELKTTLPALEAESKAAEDELNKILATIPNLPLAEVPDGVDEHGNVEHHKWGNARSYAFKPKEHFELGEALGLMDFETAAKLSGARFVVLKGGLARMERALGQLFLDVHTEEHGYTEVNPPLLVSDDTMFGTAQLPKFEEDQFRTIKSVPDDKESRSDQFSILEGLKDFELEKLPNGALRLVPISEFRSGGARPGFLDFLEFMKMQLFAAGEDAADIERKFGLWLIPTAEVPLTNLVRESIVDESTLPMRLTACTPCFRAEAGAAGRDTRGMIRQHQFTKVELVSITTPEKSKEEHERMLASAEAVLQKLDLHYRVITLCTGDMGFASQKTYDIEVWLPGQNMYREISSCSVCGDFQARRMNARYRPRPALGLNTTALNTATFNDTRGKPLPAQFVHTLNGSGVAVGRALIAVMETYQQADGSVVVPDALAPYMSGIKTIEAAKK